MGEEVNRLGREDKNEPKGGEKGVKRLRGGHKVGREKELKR